MKQYKTNIDEVAKYSKVDKATLTKYYSGELSLCKCAVDDFAALAKTFGLIEKFDCIRGYRLPKLIYPYSFNFANNTSMIKNALTLAIPEFYKHGIIEGDIFNVC